MRNILIETQKLLSGKFAKNAAYVYGAQVAGGVAGFALNLILIRHLNIEDYGLFSLYTSATMLFASFIHLGWLDAYSRFGARYAAEPVFEAVRKFFFGKILRSMVLGAGLPLIFAGWISTRLYERPQFSIYLRLAILNGVILCIWSFLNLDFQVRQRFKNYLYAQLLLSASRLTGIVFLFFFVGLSLLSVISVNFLFPLFFLLIYGWQMQIFSTKKAENIELPSAIRTQASEFRAWVLLSTVCNSVIGNIDLSILAHYHPNQTLANYGVAARLTLPLHMAMTALGMVMLPKLASNKNIELTKSQLRTLIKYIFPVSVLLLIACYFLPAILARWAGAQYASSQNLIQLFLLSSVIVFITNPPSVFLIAWGHAKMLAYLNLVQLIVDLILDLLWIPSRGAIGAIQATLVVYLIGTVFAYFQLYRALKGKLLPAK
ncbi:MAG: oligosaccharide flippase family protein [Bdellovibrionales bacterium]|nr:oligosaccharide flippase family protein [Oligoflexia bacterium]